MAQYDTITSLLGRIGLRHLVENFKTQRIDSIDTCKRLADTDLLSLGLSTIGDRARFRAEITACHENASTGDSRAFLASRSRFSRKKPARRKTWTGTFVCLADHNQTKVPCQEEKVCLQRAGLGVKKITFDSEASESEVDSVITGESGFKKLEGCGGYELLHCRSNCRNLSKIDVSWDVKSLKTVVGGQSKIYIRPIQTSLELQFENEEANTSNIKFPCMICGVEFNVRDLREHANTCLKTDNPTDNEVVNKDTTFETPFEINMPLDLNNLEFFSADLSDTVQIESSAEKSTQQVDSPTETASTFSGIENHQQNEQSEIQKITESCIEGISSQEITDPIHGLRFLQTKIVTGRKLDLEEEDLESGLTCADCSTNYLIVDRNHILSTGMDEIKELNDLRLTLEVQFYGENAEDYGGPRKEFFSLILPELKAKYFEPVRDWISLSEYETAGKIIALCLLQNGKLPRILDVNTLAELFVPVQEGFFLLSLRDWIHLEYFRL